MLSGRRAFPGEGTSEILPAVVAQDVDWNALPESTPAHVRRLIARCLDRDVKQRLRDIGEARIVLDTSDRTPTSTSAGPSCAAGSVAGRWRRAIAVALLAIRDRSSGAVAAWQLKPAAAARSHTYSRSPFRMARVLARHRASLHCDLAGWCAVGVFRSARRAVSPRACRSWTRSGFKGREGYTRVTEPVFSPDGQIDRVLRRSSDQANCGDGGAAVTIAPADAPYGISWGGAGMVFGQGGKGIMRVPPDWRHAGDARAGRGRRGGAWSADSARRRTRAVHAGDRHRPRQMGQGAHRRAVGRVGGSGAHSSTAEVTRGISRPVTSSTR